MVWLPVSELQVRLPAVHFLSHTCSIDRDSIATSEQTAQNKGNCLVAWKLHVSEKKSVLFVCLGNICRSPTGEGVLKHLVDQQGRDEEVFIDSAGTIGYHEGNPADSRMRKHAAKRGYELLSRSRKISDDDTDRFDLVIAMDRQNQEDILAIDPQATNVRLLSAFLDDSWPVDVPDPYYGGSEGFETVLDMIEAACPGILSELIDS